MPTESVENGSNLHQSKILLSCKLIDSAQPASFAFYVAFLCRSDQSPFLLFSPWRNSMWWHTRGKNVEGEKRFFKPFSNFPNDIHRKSPSRRIFSIFFSSSSTCFARCFVVVPIMCGCAWDGPHKNTIPWKKKEADKNEKKDPKKIVDTSQYTFYSLLPKTKAKYMHISGFFATRKEFDILKYYVMYS